MSFAYGVKDEICSLSYNRLESLALLSAFVRNNYELVDNMLIIQVENPKIVKLLFLLFKNIFDVNAKVENIGKNKVHDRTVYQIVIEDKVMSILESLMVYENGIELKKLPLYFIDSDDMKRAYIAGCFLACGSVNDPKTSSYHLEFLLKSEEEASTLSDMLLEFYINSKVIRRDKGYMLYVKESEKIGDFLRIVKANRAVLYYEDIRIYRDHKNMTNRLNNCEQANVDKMISASERQIKDIDFLVDKFGLDLIPDKLKDVMIYRKKYPDLSLEELANVISSETGVNLTKSGVNHRLRKIKELASKLRDKD